MLRKKLKLSVSEANDVATLVDVGCSQDPVDDGADNSNSDDCTNADQVKFSVVFELEFWEKIWQVEQSLAAELMEIDFTKDKNIAAVYNPLDYASDVHRNYMRKYLKRAPTVLFLGMNPGLFGMCQTSAS